MGRPYSLSMTIVTKKTRTKGNGLLPPRKIERTKQNGWPADLVFCEGHLLSSLYSMSKNDTCCINTQTIRPHLHHSRDLGSPMNLKLTPEWLQIV